MAGAVDSTALVASAGLVVDYWDKLHPFFRQAPSEVAPRKIHTAWERLANEVRRLELQTVDPVTSDHRRLLQRLSIFARTGQFV